MTALLPARLQPFAKVVAALTVGVLGWATSVVASDPAPVVAAEWIGLATVIAVGLGVYQTSNTPEQV